MIRATNKHCAPESATQRPPLLVFADDWGRHPSSCQHLIRRLRDRWSILWVNTVGTRKVDMTSGHTWSRGFEKLRQWASGLCQDSERMWVLDVPMLPVTGKRSTIHINRCLVTSRIRVVLRRLQLATPIVYTTLPYVSHLLQGLPRRGLIYNCTDNYAYWPSADRGALQAAEERMREDADLILAASRQLQDLHADAARCEYFPHGVDYEHFASVARRDDVPPELQCIPGPRVGFFGLIYEKLDFALLSALADRLPEVNFVFLGPVDYCPTEFCRRKNVHLLGKQPYAELPRWLAGLDCLLMPYVQDEMIRQSNPLKLRECLATGKPTVSVSVPEVQRFCDYVRIADEPDAFIRAVDDALQEPVSAPIAARRQQAVQQESWNSRAQELDRHLTAMAKD